MLLSCSDPLPEEKEKSEKLYSIHEAFTIVARENEIARTLYTKAIVGAGKDKGLKFDENWHKDNVEAGPLPALFLRATSSEIQKTSVPLGLFLGSDYPVNKANEFAGKQKELFEEIKKDRKPKFFFDESSGKYTAMFPDLAVAQACISCHNEHPETPKTDWKMGDIMGATTWTYPKDSISFEELKAILMVYREGAAATYDSYLKKVTTFKASAAPEIGKKWPKDGYFLPEVTAFMDSLSLLTANSTLKGILKTGVTE